MIKLSVKIPRHIFNLKSICFDKKIKNVYTICMYMYSIFGQIYITREPSYRSCNFFTEEIGVRHEDENTNPPMNVI